MFSVPPSLRVLSLASGVFVLLSSAPALADCQTDIQGYMKRRDSVVAQLKGMQKGGKKQLDPGAACPKFRSLTSIMTETVAYFEKNKEWCQIPDNFVDGAKQQRAQFAKTAGQACGIAAKIEKMKKQAAQQQAQGGGMGQQVQQLPHGPL
ncbi:MAG: hypothetical protein QM651_06885 [Rhodoblastus sp.]